MVRELLGNMVISCLPASTIKPEKAAAPSRFTIFPQPFTNQLIKMNRTRNFGNIFVLASRQGILALALLALTLLPSNAARCSAEEPAKTQWNQFRGENGVASVATCDVPLPWSPSDIAWEVKLPGVGNCSPVYYGNKVFLMSADPNNAERYLLAYDLKTGEKLWQKTIASEPYHLHARSSFASGTPCVNDKAVFFSWATPDRLTLAAFTHDGEEYWQEKGAIDLGPFVSQHGYGASPVLFGKTLVLFNSQQAEELPPNATPGLSRVMAFNSESGEMLWETPRTTTRACYGVPKHFKDESGVEALLFANTGDGIFAIELETGKPLWNKKVFGKRCVSCPTIIGDLAIGTEGSGGGGNVLYGVSLTGEHKVEFKVDRSAPYVPSPVSKGNMLFLWGDTGIVSCIEAPSGEVVWSKRIGGNASSSPVIAGDKLIGIAEDGTVTMLAASREFKELGEVKLEDTCRATPALNEHFILFRTHSRLLCVGKP